MSIYSGFATRQQQQTYDQCLDSLLYVLQKKVLKQYTNEHADESKFKGVVLRLFNQLKHMEQHKYLEPKSSRAVQELVEFLTDQSSNSRFKQSSLILNHDKQISTIEKQLVNNTISSRKHSYSIPIRQKHFMKINTIKKQASTLNYDKPQNLQKNKLKRPLSHAKYLSREVAKKDQVAEIINDYVKKAKKNYLKGYRQSHKQMFQDYK